MVPPRPPEPPESGAPTHEFDPDTRPRETRAPGPGRGRRPPSPGRRDEDAGHQRPDHGPAHRADVLDPLSALPGDEQRDPQAGEPGRPLPADLPSGLPSGWGLCPIRLA